MAIDPTDTRTPRPPRPTWGRPPRDSSPTPHITQHHTNHVLHHHLPRTYRGPYNPHIHPGQHTARPLAPTSPSLSKTKTRGYNNQNHEHQPQRPLRPCSHDPANRRQPDPPLAHNNANNNHKITPTIHPPNPQTPHRTLPTGGHLH